MDKVIFLDIDGVLNSEDYFIHRSTDWKGEFKFAYDLDAIAVERLNTILQETNAEVVLSSSWRFSPLDEVVDALRIKGFKYDIKYITTKKDMDRGLQILKFVSEHNVKDYIVLDDDAFDIENHISSKQFIKTTWKNGLLQEHVDAIINYFKKGRLKRTIKHY